MDNVAEDNLRREYGEADGLTEFHSNPKGGD